MDPYIVCIEKEIKSRGKEIHLKVRPSDDADYSLKNKNYSFVTSYFFMMYNKMSIVLLSLRKLHFL